MSALAFDSVSHQYRSAGQNLLSVENISFEVQQGEFVALVGSSGSGKSTLLRIAAGLDAPLAGHIRINNELAKGRKGLTAYMPQSDTLLPWLTTLDNVILGAKINGQYNANTTQTALELFGQFGLAGFDRHYPAQLSGGMRQRVAFLRTFLMHTSPVLLDEPLSALDAITRAELQDWLLKIWDYFHYSILFVTHDIFEAVYLADRVIVLSSRPAKIAGNIAIDIPRPRQRADKDVIEKIGEIETLIRSN